MDKRSPEYKALRQTFKVYFSDLKDNAREEGYSVSRADEWVVFLAVHQQQLATDAIEQLKAWCLDNYESGADTMVECWDYADYQKLLDDCDGSLPDALNALKSLASVYADQQADARYHADVAADIRSS